MSTTTSQMLDGKMATIKALLPDPSIALPEPEQEPITKIFSNWAAQIPAYPAIIQEEHTWTYGELAATAQTIAQILQSHQVEIGDTVAVTGWRSFGLIASMLGVLMSGGVLLNIDPNLPQARQQLMLTTAKAKYLIYIGTKVPETNLTEASVEVITINPQTGKPIAPEYTSQAEYTSVEILGNDSAYIFFTSGTTGTPKGVLGCHKGLSHFLNWQRQTFNITPQDRAAQLTGLSFDVVLRDIFLPLTSGATLCLPSVTDNLTPDAILPWIEKQQISLLHTVPTLTQSWLMNVPPGISLRALRRVFFAGEPLTDTLILRWREAFPESGEIINLYGPTETTLAKCYYRVPAENILPGVQPVGSPLPQTQALVFTPNHQLCEIGESGEIVIRTPFRSKGYINASGENLSKFVKNPFREDEQDLLYYTGDRGRYLPDGVLEILGRVDHQVKIRGVRIEPGEIGALLDKHSKILANVIIAREDIPGEKRLVAYCVPHKETAPTTSELREFLKKQLPDYMVPSAFVMLEALPLTPNGKIDRRALPAPNYSRQESENTFVSPRNQLEIQLTKIWEKVLGVQPIGIRDNFFELGGHSLLAMRMFAEIEKTLGIKLSLGTLFQAQTIEKLAAVIDQKGCLAQCKSLVLIQAGSHTKPLLFCMHARSGNVLFYRKLARHLDPEQPFYALEAQGVDGEKAPLTSIQEMAKQYIQEMRMIQPEGPYFLGGFSFGGLVAFEIAQQLHTQGQEVALLALFDSEAPYSIESNSGLLKQRPKTLCGRIWLHTTTLLNLGFKRQVNYLRDRLQWHFTAGKASIFYRIYLHYIKRAPSELRLIKVGSANNEAQSNYVARIYTGKLTVIATTETIAMFKNDPELGWGQLTSGGVETHEVPGTHTTIMEDPNVRFLAEKLISCLQQTQASAAFK